MRFLLISSLALALWGCASQKVYVSPRAQLRLDRQDIVELNEAFKTAVEKTITLESAGEIECAERSCIYPVRGTAKVLKDGQGAGTETIKGNLLFTRESTARLIELMDMARVQAKEQIAKGSLGETVCSAKSCSLDFSLEGQDGRRDVPLAKVVLE